MKLSRYTILSILAGLSLLVASIKVAYDLYTFESSLSKALKITEIQQKNIITTHISYLAFFVGLMFISAVFALMFSRILRLSSAIGEEKQSDYYIVGEKSVQATTATTSTKRSFGDMIAIQQALGQYHDKELLEKILSIICKQLHASQGALYIARQEKNIHYIELNAGYAYYIPESESLVYEFGEGIAGQVAKDGKSTLIRAVPDGYIKVISGLGAASPNNLLVVPIKDTKEVVLGIIEVASFENFNEIHRNYVETVAQALSPKISTLQIKKTEAPETSNTFKS